jgi:hypothetical protein
VPARFALVSLRKMSALQGFMGCLRRAGGCIARRQSVNGKLRRSLHDFALLDELRKEQGRPRPVFGA